MKKNLAEWKIRNTYTFAEATLLMLGYDPGEWSTSKLIEKAPPKFNLIFGKMIEDAKDELHYEKDDDGRYRFLYALMSDNPANINSRSHNEWLTTTSDTFSLNKWSKSLMTQLESLHIEIKGINLKFFNDEIEEVISEPIEMKIHPRVERSYLRLIYALTEKLDGFDKKHPYKTAQAIIDLTAITSPNYETIGKILISANEIAAKDEE